MTATPDSSVREIVTGDFRAAAVLEHFGIDFCCGGRRTLGEACRARNINPLDVLIEVNQACERADRRTPQFASWEPDALIAYIVNHHHAYVRRALPIIVTHLRKVASAHGVQHPEMIEVAEIFEGVADDMTSHMEKEEEILFPYIGGLQTARLTGEPPPFAPFGSLNKPIAMMEQEHESAGDAMRRIRELTADFTPPAGACATYTVCLRELEEFEHDLHYHVHLENNVLFPKALTMHS